MNDAESEGYNSAPVIIQLDDGTLLWPQADDEGNDAGALGIQPSNKLAEAGVEELAPVI